VTVGSRIVVVASLWVLACGEAPAAPEVGPAAAARSAVAPATAAADGAPRALVAGQLVVDRLAGRDRRVFTLALAAGQAAAITVEGREVNTRLIVGGPGGERVFVEDLSSAVPAIEESVVVAAAAGTYRLTVQAVSAPGVGGEFAVRAEVRAASARDRQVAELITRGYHLRRDSGRNLLVVVDGDPPVSTPPSPAAVFDQAGQALALARQLGDAVREARLLGFQGDMRRVDERFAEAAGLWRAALRRSRAAGDRAGEGTALGWLGWLALTGGDIAADLRLTREALAVCRAARHLGCVAQRWYELGEIHLRLGDGERALEAYREAATFWRQLDNTFQHSVALMGVAMGYDAVGDAARALAAVDEAEAAWSPEPGVGQAEMVGYRALVRGSIWLGAGRDPARAVPYLETALALGREAHTSMTVVAALLALGEARRALGAPAQAVALIGEALALADRAGLGSDREAARLALGRAHHAAGDLEAARGLLRAVAERARADSAEHREAEALTALARVERDRGDRPAALAAIHAAVARVESTRARIHADALRATYLAAARATYDVAVELVLDDGRPRAAERALAIAEQARARTLRETLAAARVATTRAADPALARAAADAREAVRLQEVAHELLLARAAAPAEVAASRRELARRTREYREVEGRLAAADPALARLFAPPQLDVAALQARLAPGDRLLVYNLGDGVSTLWLLSAARVAVVRLPSRAILDEQIRTTLALVSARGPSAPGEVGARRAARIRGADAMVPGALEALSHMILGAARDQLDGTRLLIVPDGGIASVPFAAIPGPGGQPLIERHEIVVVPAAALLLDETRPRRPARRIAILADPAFSADDPRLAAPAAATGPAPFPRLPWTGVEAARISALAPGAFVATGAAASEERFREPAVASADVVHVATHGALDVDAPELSAIVLAQVDEQGQPRDGLLRLHEIMELRLAAALVVLSACETALGQRVAGEGLIGLVRAFLHAGAGQVMASLWPIQDQGTAELMTRFYAALLGGEHDAAAALRSAQRALRADPRWSAPYYWAAFLLQGVPPRVPLAASAAR
jgi:tetratricopeptide (TPR) repeat protein